MLDLHGSSKKSTVATEQPFRLYGCHANITYSRPQSSDGKHALELISVLLGSWCSIYFLHPCLKLHVNCMLNAVYLLL
jgi:hypothetical protein